MPATTNNKNKSLSLKALQKKILLAHKQPLAKTIKVLQQTTKKFLDYLRMAEESELSESLANRILQTYALLSYSITGLLESLPENTAMLPTRTKLSLLLPKLAKIPPWLQALFDCLNELRTICLVAAQVSIPVKASMVVGDLRNLFDLLLEKREISVRNKYHRRFYYLQNTLGMDSLVLVWLKEKQTVYLRRLLEKLQKEGVVGQRIEPLKPTITKNIDGEEVPMVLYGDFTKEPPPLTNKDLQAFLTRVKDSVKITVPKERILALRAIFQDLWQYLKTIEHQAFTEAFANEAVKVLAALASPLVLLVDFHGASCAQINEELRTIRTTLQQDLPAIYTLFDCLLVAFGIYSNLIKQARKKFATKGLFLAMGELLEALQQEHIISRYKNLQLFLYRNNVQGLAFDSVTWLYGFAQEMAQREREAGKKRKQKEEREL